MKERLVHVLRLTKHFFSLFIMKLKRVILVISGKPIIYVFGDSHTLNLYNSHFDINHVGPATAYKLSSKISTTMASEKINRRLNILPSKKTNYFLFVFGEIDCRIHINKISKDTNSPLSVVINNTVTSYGKYLLEIKHRFPQSKIMILNVLPPGEEKNIYHVMHYPTRKSHMRIVRQFNRQLELFCRENDFFFINIFDELLDKEGNRLNEYIHDPVHFNKKIQPLLFQKINHSLREICVQK